MVVQFMRVGVVRKEVILMMGVRIKQCEDKRGVIARESGGDSGLKFLSQ